MSFDTIPMLDLDKVNNPDTRPELLQDLRHALLEVGFLYIKNTNIELELFGKVKAYGKAIFDIPEFEK
jgi:isopenicillin N synthase-like dioxygenase